MSTGWIIAFGVLSVFVFLLGLLELGTLRRVADLLERSEVMARRDEHPAGGLEPGSPVPPFTGELLDGASITSEALAGKPYVLVFVSSECPACERLLRELPSAGRFEARMLLVVDEFSDAAGVVGAIGVTIVRQIRRRIARAFNTTATPHGFVVDEYGAVAAARITNSVADVRRLLADGLAGTRSAKRHVVLSGFDGLSEHI